MDRQTATEASVVHTARAPRDRRLLKRKEKKKKKKKKAARSSPVARAGKRGDVRQRRLARRDDDARFRVSVWVDVQRGGVQRRQLELKGVEGGD
jgi:hypothetical protein